MKYNITYEGIPLAERQESYLMSSSQKRMHLIQQLDQQSVAYNMPSAIKLIGNVDVERIKKALNTLVERHEILRTNFVTENGQLKQRIKEKTEAEFECIEDRESSEAELIERFVVPFELDQGPLVRMKLIKRKENSLLLLDMHHIISDGMSIRIFLNEFSKLYNGEVLDKLPLQYKDYSEWVRKKDVSEQKEYWRNVFADEVPMLDMPVDYPRSSEQSFRGNTKAMSIGQEDVKNIKKLALETGSTEYMVFLSSAMALLGRYSRQEDIIIGSPISGRTHRDTQDMLGMFVNTLAMRGKPERSKSYEQLLAEVKDTSLKVYENQEFPYEELVEEVNVVRDMSRNPLFDVMLVMQNNEKAQLKLSDVESENVQLSNMTSKFDLTFYIEEMLDQYEITLEYCSDLFKESSAENILKAYLRVLKQVSTNKEIKIKDIELINEAEREIVLKEFNHTFTEYPRDKTVVQLFEEQVEKTPDHIAVICEGAKITYRELNQKSNQLAHLLREKGVTRDTSVAILAKRNIESIIGIHGIIKAGGAYVPVDPAYPKERINYMLKDSAPKVVLTYKTSLETDIEVIDLSDERLYKNNFIDSPVNVNKPEDLIYVIYTSGTTGKPKGVMIEHQSVVSLKNYVSSSLKINDNDNVLQFANFIFDPSVLGMVISLLHGGILNIPSDEVVHNPPILEEYCRDQNISVVLITPNYYLNMGDVNARMVIVGGSESSKDLLEKSKNSKYINSYGPTETGVVATHWDKSYSKKINNKVPIGKPITNKEIYILDDMQLCGIGIVGEICIAGEGLARGYLNQEELTKEKFIDNPFGEGRLYRSGDLGRWLDDGNIEFLGRIDEQVKIRGFRIELGEIESALKNHLGVKEAAVIAKEDKTGDKGLYAYIVAEKDVEIDSLRDSLTQELPEYMIPGYIMKIEALPLTINGKLDKKALPEIEIKTGNEYIAPRNQQEELVSEAFKEVLGLEKVGVKDNFFALGGHSLRATILVNSIEEKTGIRLELKSVLTNGNIEYLSKLIEHNHGAYEGIPLAERLESYEMSSSQKRTYLIQELDKQSVAYNEPTVIKLTGAVDVERIKNALNMLVERHEILRTDFITENGQLKQRIRAEAKVELESIEDMETSEAELIEGFLVPFELDQSPLVRMKLVKRKEDSFLMLDMHHIVSDGMSIGIFLNEFSMLYNGQELDKLSLQYKDYSEWIRKKDVSEQKEYWRNVFADEVPVLDMPVDYPRPSEQSFRGNIKAMTIGQEDIRNIKKLALEMGSTEYMVFLSSAMVLLGRYSRQEDIIIGSAISGRTHRDTEGMLGMFVNTLAMRGKPERAKSYEQLLAEVKDTSLKAYENQEFPYEELVEEVNVIRDMSRNPLFDVMLVMQNNEKAQLTLSGIEAEHLPVSRSTAKFDLTFQIEEAGDEYQITLEYCSDLYKESSAENILKAYLRVLKQVSTNKEIKIKDIELINEAEREIVLKEFNDTFTEYPRNKTVAQLFEEQVEKTPDHTAVICDGAKMTYRELNEKSNQLAHILREKGVTRDTFVAILAERNIETIVGIYGIIKAGGAYLPVDPKYPKDRINYMLEDSAPKAVLTYKTSLETDIEVIDLSDEKLYKNNFIDNPTIVNKPEDLIYVIYTSGTTGKPKGVMIEHRNVVRLVKNTDYVELNENTKILQTGSLSFDASTFEIFGSLLNGGQLALINVEDLTNSNTFMSKIKEYEINTIWVTATLFNQMVDSEKAIFDSVKNVLVGGERLSEGHIKQVADRKKTNLINGYGPTESTTFTATHRIQSVTHNIPIGRPISNTKVYITDGMNLCGIGMVGEILIAGEGLARGYLNQEELTKEKFIDNPFGEGKLYRSGDLGRWLEDGCIEFLGRIDEQVKIRGFRIELGEIESALKNQPGVKEAAVIVKKDKTGDKGIYVYIVADQDVEIDSLRDNLTKELPEYMIPSYMMKIEAIPLTINGKLDRRALPEIEVKTGNEYIAPRNAQEVIVSEAFTEVLGVEKVGVKDNFFALGGHSLRATILVNSIEEKTGIRLDLKSILTNGSIEYLSKLIGNQHGVYKGIPLAERQESYPMSSSQKRTYLIQQLDQQSVAYNMPSTIKLIGDVDVERIKKTLSTLVERHEILRTNFITENGQLKQKINADTVVDFEYIEDMECTEEQLIEGLLVPFDLSEGPLVRMKLIKRKENSLFLLDMHHIISDGMSLGIFLNEFSKRYNGERLDKLTLQYKDYSEWIRKKDVSEQKEYWKNAFADEIPVLDMPIDYPRPSEQSFRGNIKVMSIGQEDVKNIKKLALETESTEYMVFLSSAMALLGRYSRQQDVIIGTPISGRTHRDTEGMLGMFVNTLAMRGKPERTKSYEQLLAEVKDTSLKAYENQEFPYEELVEEVNVIRDMSRNPMFDVMLVMQNNEKTQLTLSGVEAEHLQVGHTISKLDLTFQIEEVGDQYEVTLEYCSDLYKESSAENILKAYLRVLKQVSTNKGIKIKDIELISEAEREIVLNEFNHTPTEYPRDKTVVQLFEEQVEKTPDHIAVICQGEKITYWELNQKSNQLAHLLREKGVTRDTFVGILAERNIESIIGIYGTIKAGGAYVPLDPTYPKERIDYMIKDSNPKVVLTYKTNMGIDGDVIDLSDKKIFESTLVENPDQINKPEDLMYGIYTSGTTGKPKGVLIEHQSIVSLKNYVSNNIDINDNDNVLQFANLIFDPSVLGMVISLLHGAILNIPSNDVVNNPKLLEEYCKNQNISVILITPNYYLNMSDVNARIVIVGGSESSIDLIEKSKNGQYINSYGPTEIGVVATHWDKSYSKKIYNKVPIGKPITNKKIYLLDDLQLCGIGMVGEICIAGEGLARGYLNQQELTNQKFIDNPFGEGRLYRSGDLGRWLDDGNIEFLGRVDEQIKIRGFRIELGEIESALKNYPGVKEAVVIAKEDKTGDKGLYAYIVAEQDVEVDSLRGCLTQELPNYMVPSYMMKIVTLPLTINGKLDKRALPEIEVKTGNEYIAPRNQQEQVVSEAFKEVLGLEKVGIKDNFFALGGHSLRATILVNSIEEKTGIRLELKSILTNGSIEYLSELIGNQSGVYEGIPLAERQESYKMSSSQKRTYLIQELDKQSVVYNMPGAIRLVGVVDVERIKNALHMLIERHEILRTDFVTEDGELKQKIKAETEVELEEGLFGCIEDTKSSEAQLFEEFVAPFDLSQSPLVRMKLIKRKADSLLLLDMHHIISDGMSIGIFLNEFTKLYNGEKLDKLSLQYKDYSEWIRNKDVSEQKEYWKNVFADEIPVLDMPIDYPRPSEQSFRGNIKVMSIGQEDIKKIKKLALETESTEYMIFLSSAMALLGRYSRQQDIIIGSPISGRTHRDTEGMLGMFVNTLAMRGKPEREKSYQQLLAEVKDTSLKAYENQEFPYEALVEEVNVIRDMSRNPLFDVMLVMQNNEKAQLMLSGVDAEPVQAGHTISKFDLTFHVEEIGDEYQIALEYCSDLYKESSAENILKAYLRVLKQVSTSKEIKIKDIELIDETEREIVLKQFNNTFTEYPRDKTVARLFEQQVEKTPDHNAVICNGAKITYRELNQKSNQLAHILREKGVTRDTFVAILAERNIETIIGIYGIIKAGGAYVPVDPKYPKDRINYMLQDSNPKVVLTYKTNIEFSGDVIDLSDRTIFESGLVDNPENINKPEDLIYVIYTSGTTGKPKGVMIEHRNVIRLVKNTNYVELNEYTKILQTGSLSFDASTFEVFGSLLNGGQLVLINIEDLTDSNTFMSKIKEYKINTIWVTATLFNQMVDSEGAIFDSVKYVLVGGERLSEGHIKQVSDRKTTNLINGYGPTESTTFTTTHRIESVTYNIPIGRPISNTKVYIMDGKKLCGIGMAGEILIAGEGLARGYLNQEELTKEKFIDNPYGEGKLYRSGDLGRWLEDGCIEFLGRIDEQVKIRGFRIELGEIESALKNQPGVKEAAVIVKRDKTGDKGIYAYIVSEQDVEIDSLRDDLMQELPEYMIPGYMMKIESIPLTINGKLDKRALPEIEVKTANEYIAPRNEREQLLSQIFEEILGIEKVSIKDNFFALGGDSIKAIRIVTKLREAGYDINVRGIMLGKTVETIAKVAAIAKELYYQQGEVVGEVKATPIIEVFKRWELEQPHHFNQSMIIKVEGTPNDVETVIDAVVSHHDMLRSVYVDGRLEILGNEEKRYKYEVYDYCEKDNEEQELEQKCDEVQRSINLEKGPLFNCVLFRVKEGNYLFMCSHHLVVDGVSWRILVEDIQNGIKQLMDGKEVKLPMKTASFKEWSEALNEYKNSKKLKREISYWQKIGATLDEGRYIGEPQKIEVGYETVLLELSKQDTNKLLKESSEAYNTEINDLLLSSLGMAVKQVKGQGKVAIMIEGHGREELDKSIKIDRTVGWFTSMYPIILECCENVEESIIRTKEMLRRVPNRGIGYGLLVEDAKESDISFNYLGEIDEGKELGKVYRTGQDISEHNKLPGGGIALNGLIRNGKLIFAITYNLSRYSKEEVSQLVTAYKTKLLEEIFYCCTIGRTIITASDLTDEVISEDDFVKIAMLLG